MSMHNVTNPPNRLQHVPPHRISLLDLRETLARFTWPVSDSMTSVNPVVADARITSVSSLIKPDFSPFVVKKHGQMIETGTFIAQCFSAICTALNSEGEEWRSNERLDYKGVRKASVGQSRGRVLPGSVVTKWRKRKDNAKGDGTSPYVGPSTKKLNKMKRSNLLRWSSGYL
ncbi:hypothetical protein OSTOST_02756 [Ostertagia ostertagi]